MSAATPAEAEQPPFRCDYCDIETQQALSSRLLHTIAIRSTYQKISIDDAVLKLREKLLPPAKTKKNEPPSLSGLHAALKTLDEARAKGLDSIFTGKDEMQRRVSKCEKDMEVSSYVHVKRDQLAVDLIRAYDPGREYHCGACVPCKPDASQGASEGASEGASPASVSAIERHRLSCVFRPVPCRNEGCVEMLSAKAEASHDARCAFKVLPCTLGCGAMVQRQGMSEHTDGPCPNKPVDCPFALIGCEEACTQGGLEAHLREACSKHLSLTLTILTLQQRSINTLEATSVAATTAAAELMALRERMGQLESTTADLRREIRQSEQELRAALQQGVERAAAQSAKELKRVEADVHKQGKAVKAHGAEHEQLSRTVDAVANRLSALIEHGQ